MNSIINQTAKNLKSELEGLTAPEGANNAKPKASASNAKPKAGANNAKPKADAKPKASANNAKPKASANNAKPKADAKPKAGTKPKAGAKKKTKPTTKTSANNRAGKKQTKKQGMNNKKIKNRSLVGKMPDFNNTASEIKMSKTGLRKILKSLFSDMGLSEKETLELLKDLGKDEQSVQNLTKFINKTKQNDLKKKADIIKNMNSLKDTILTIYKLFDELNNNLGILFERKTKK